MAHRKRYITWWGLKQGAVHALPGALLAGLCGLMSVPAVGSLGTAVIMVIAGSIASICFFQWRRAAHALEREKQGLPLADIAGAAAHDINNLITAISGAIALLERASARGDEKMHRRVLSSIERSTERCKAVTSELLCLSRADKGRAAVGPVALGEVVAEVISGLSLCEGAMRHRFSIVGPDTPLFGVCDENGLHQVLLNLGMNAIDAMTEPGSVIFEISRRGFEHVTISVKDNGCGMSRTVMRSMFDPYFTTKRRRATGRVQLGGSGLGLTSVRFLVESWGGEIECSSEPQRGTTFTVVMTRADSARDTEMRGGHGVATPTHPGSP